MAPLHDQHYSVAFLYAVVYKIVGGFVGVSFNLGEGESSALPFFVYPQKRLFMRRLLRQSVQNIKAEVKVSGNVERNALQSAFFVNRFIHVFFVKPHLAS